MTIIDVDWRDYDRFGLRHNRSAERPWTVNSNGCPWAGKSP
jgi:hypothetical protein